ncbi:heterokaryon incompatibility protein-domain-containing protein [Paraphoma chrysanthemicola]|nr:heterokaryon incompatibility protein-domain-containing protein [Paraphoma chrysanthemicola]
MSSSLRNISKGFWTQYPVGTKLTWSFVGHQLKQNHTAVFNFMELLKALITNFVRVWQVLALPLMCTMDKDVLRKSMPQDSRVSAIAYVVVAYPIGYCIAAIGFSAAAVLSLAAIVILPAFAAAVVLVWMVGVSLLFVLWFALYRYPVFELIYPRLRTWMLTKNSPVYSAIPTTVPIIRIVRLKAGNYKDTIECDLLTTPLTGASFEALSYVWGVTLAPYKIQVDGRPFYITHNLYTALRELRFPDRDRQLWIDAMSINQYNNAEKAAQVQMMRDVYATAERTIIWLGKARKATRYTFDFIRGFNDTGGSVVRWKDRTRVPRWQSIRRELENLLQYEWWERAWIIQEVVVSETVVVQRGSHQVGWDSLHDLVTYLPFSDEFPHLEKVAQFAEDIQELRTGETATEPISNTLLGLAYRFRYQSATFGSDKVYALMGLLRSNNSTLLQPDYNKLPEDVFVDFTISALRNNQNLTAVALAAGAELQGVSWCRDWRFNHDGAFETFWFSAHLPPGRPYLASGTHPPVLEANIEARELSLKGFPVDTIARVGDFYQQIRDNVNWDLALRNWERVAGGPLIENSEAQKAFNRTITADSWLIEPIDWRQRIVRRGQQPRTEEDARYKKIIDDACLNRRFFITRKGRFGLGPWNLRKGDEVCVLLGGKTPFILRQCSKREEKGRAPDLEKKGKAHHKVIGETFVDSLMYYEGSMEDDIDSGEVVPKWYHLL